MVDSFESWWQPGAPPEDFTVAADAGAGAVGRRAVGGRTVDGRATGCWTDRGANFKVAADAGAGAVGSRTVGYGTDRGAGCNVATDADAGAVGSRTVGSKAVDSRAVGSITEGGAGPVDTFENMRELVTRLQKQGLIPSPASARSQQAPSCLAQLLDYRSKQKETWLQQKRSQHLPHKGHHHQGHRSSRWCPNSRVRLWI